MGLKMTEQTLKEANEILRKIEKIEKLRGWIYHNPYIKQNKDDYDGMYLSWADNEDKGLQNTIVKWCDEEVKKLKTRFNEL